MSSKKIKEDILDIYKNLEKDDEFETIFYDINRFGKKEFNVSEKKFIEILSNISLLGKNELIPSLHIIYNYDKDIKYRIEINTLDEIKKYITLLKNSNKNVTFRSLLKVVGKNKNVVLVKKTINRKKIIDDDNLGVRYRLSKEISNISKSEMNKLENIGFMEGNEIIYRYRERVSYATVDNDDIKIAIELTYIKMTNFIDKIPYINGNYEVEIELNKKNKNASVKYLETFFKQISYILKIKQQSNILLIQDESNMVIRSYAKMMYNNELVSPDRLATRNTVDLHLENLLNDLPNQYIVLDKADGLRYFLIVENNDVYLMSNNMEIKKVVINQGNEYNKTILDGEYIFVKEQQKYIFMAFDLLFYKGEDYRKKKLPERIVKMNEVLNKYFNYNLKVNTSTGKTIGEIEKYYDSKLNNYLDELNNYIKNGKGFLIRPKMIIFPIGIDKLEIYLYSRLIWRIYETKAPYFLDGLIFTPIDEYYKTKNLKEFKWKPIETLSIDFYIKFKRDLKTEKILTVFDNSEGDDNFYYICDLFVGKSMGKYEEPVPFMKEINEHYTHLYLKNGNVYDEDNIIIRDGTVVEFRYNPNGKEKFKWIPMRTRYDKTKYVLLNKRKYGNSEMVANDIWTLINNPIHINDIEKLSDPKTYMIHKYNLTNKFSPEEKKDVYYQKNDKDFMKPLRNFHNWIKNNLILMYCKPYIIDDKIIQKDILDIAIGSGGDIGKYIHAGAKMVVGIDIDKHGLQKKGGAVDRYNHLLKNKKLQYNINSPKINIDDIEMYFIQADARNLLESKYQNKSLPNLDPKYSKLIKKYFDNKYKFDVISCQFAIHYFFENQDKLNKFQTNINNHLKEDGYFIFTTFDGESVFNLLKDKTQYDFDHIDENGNKNTIFQIKKLYTEDNFKDVNIGSAIDVLNTIISNNYVREYLVSKEFVIENFKNRCNLVCIETDTFSNILKINENFFKEMSKTQRYYKDFTKLYETDDKINMVGRQFSSLSRYYIFKKIKNKLSKKEIEI